MARLNNRVALITGGARSLAAVALSLPHPAAQRLACAANFSGDRADRSPLRGMLAMLLAHQANRSLANFRRKPPLSGVCHR